MSRDWLDRQVTNCHTFYAFIKTAKPRQDMGSECGPAKLSKKNIPSSRHFTMTRDFFPTSLAKGPSALAAVVSAHDSATLISLVLSSAAVVWHEPPLRPARAWVANSTQGVLGRCSDTAADPQRLPGGGVTGCRVGWRHARVPR